MLWDFYDFSASLGTPYDALLSSEILVGILLSVLSGRVHILGFDGVALLIGVFGCVTICAPLLSLF